jgi:hypothetical protein
MALDALKCFLPDRPVLTRIWRGPFRGARVMLNPRNSLRKIFGLYEYELNSWLEQALRRVTRVIDIGAHDGYFTFGCAAAFRRLRKRGEIIAVEPQAAHLAVLRQSLAVQPEHSPRVDIIQAFVGREPKTGVITLDSIQRDFADDNASTLIKIDVDGPEVEVIEGGCSSLRRSNLFVIEVHEEIFIERLRALFANKQLRLVLIRQRPLPFLGYESRPKDNCWLVSDLTAAA